MPPSHIKTREQLDPIFNPTSVAVVGATSTAGTVPYDIFANLMRDKFQGMIFPVSPGNRSIDGVKTYKYVKDIEDPVDLAILVFPNTVCSRALEQCGQKGIKGAIVISAGFKETGPEGIEREKQLKAIADQYGISFIGPNCLGVINTDPSVRLDASFARAMPDEGPIGFLSQSGALCTAVLDYARSKHIGFSKFVSFGNKADISEIDLLYYLKDDPKTQVILIYLEEISDGKALMQAARDIISETGKPILALKSGRTSQGAAAAASHTGSLAGSDNVCDAALKQAGIIRCKTIDEMFHIAMAMAYQPLPRGNRVAIVTNAGGPGVLTTDAAIEEGLELANFSEETTEKFKRALPKTANIHNPVDVIGDARADRYNAAVTAVLADDNVDGALVILTPQSMTDIEQIADEISALGHQSDKPVYASFMGEADVASGIDILLRRHIPHYTVPEAMCRSFARALKFRQECESPATPAAPYTDFSHAKAQAALGQASGDGRNLLRPEEISAVLTAYGLPLVRDRVAASADEAAKWASELGFPVVMKVMSDQITHKVDVGGVVLNIESAGEARSAYDRIMANAAKNCPNATVRGVLVQRMMKGGEEVILGIKRDPSFGAVVMFGLGGTFVEIFKDVSFRVAPIDPAEVHKMIRQIRAYPILNGARGRVCRDLAAVEDCIQRLTCLALDCPEIKELDLNPLFVFEEGKGCYVGDARIMI
ncbi:acetate--CoA ligase family protein [bacterium]|nr:acetate--CoA ligase family protein [bacterium]